MLRCHGSLSKSGPQSLGLRSPSGHPRGRRPSHKPATPGRSDMSMLSCQDWVTAKEFNLNYHSRDIKYIVGFLAYGNVV